MYVSHLLDIPSVTSESPSELKTLLNGTVKILSALEQLKQPVKQWNVLIIPLNIRKLDARTFREWETSISKSSGPPTFTQSQEWIQQRVDILETIAESHGTKGKKLDSRTSRVQAHFISKDTGAYCSGSHFILHCSNFKEKSLSERKTFVTTKGLCFNCLGFHRSLECRNTNRCRDCKGEHHTLLHDPTRPLNVNTAATVTYAFASTSVLAPIMQPNFTKGQSINVNVICASTSIQSALLATALVTVRDTNGCLHTARAIISRGSQCSIVSEALIEKLKLPRMASTTSVTRVANSYAVPSKGSSILDLSPYHGQNTRIKFTAQILPLITSYGPRYHALPSTWTHLKGVQLADNFESPPNEINILFGADLYPEIVLEGLVKGPVGTLMAQKTIFGWVLSGPNQSPATYSSP